MTYIVAPENIDGLLLGMGLGDALSRTHPAKNPPYLLHSATGTWFIAVMQSLQQSDESALTEDLLLRLQILHAPFSGAALRSKMPSLGGTLKQVATHYARYRNPTSASCADPIGDVLPCMMPLAFLNDKDDVLAAKVVAVASATHRHPRVVSAAAFLIACIRQLGKNPSISRDEMFENALPLSTSVLTILKTQSQCDVKHISLAQQALLHHAALGKGVADADDLGFPFGYDGRDSPEQLVVLALVMSDREGVSIAHTLESIVEKKGASDILAPLIGAIAGLRFGSSIFPSRWLERFFSKELWSSCTTKFNSRSLLSTSDLVEKELKLSQLEGNLLKESGTISSHEKEQLQFF